MTETTAFERQLSGEITDLMGPVRPVDDAAIFSSITATQSPKWRFQSMFSATKFVVAGAIVALFGGFLLSGILTQPSDESAPVAGASVSASPVTTPTEKSVSTDTPAPTPPSPIMPGAELDLEQVAPGVFQVNGDGVRDLTAGVRQVVVAPSGDVWVEIGGDKNSRVVRLGEPGVSYDLGSPRRLGLSPDGAPLIELTKQRTVVFDGTDWVTYEGEPELEPLPCDEPIVLDNGVVAHGACWLADRGLPMRMVGDTEERVEKSEIGIAKDQWAVGEAVGEDGTLWMTIHDGDSVGRFAGLVAFDGETWTRHPYDDAVEAEQHEELTSATVGLDGRVWVQRTHLDPSGTRLTLSSWDGKSWDDYGPIEHPNAWGPFPFPDENPLFRPDGTAWFFDGRLKVEGSTLQRMDVPEGALVVGPDGTMWKKSGMAGWASREPLYLITPEAVAE